MSKGTKCPDTEKYGSVIQTKPHDQILHCRGGNSGHIKLIVSIISFKMNKYYIQTIIGGYLNLKFWSHKTYIFNHFFQNE